MIKAIANLILALNSNVRASQMAAGFAFGLLLALVPAGNLLWLVLVLLTFYTKVHFGMQFLVTALFKLVSPLLSGPLDSLGWTVLHLEMLQKPFTALYNLPLAPFTHFNNTLVAGGLVAGLALWVPAFLLAYVLVKFYRARLAPLVAKSKWFQAFRKLPLVKSVAQAVEKATVVARAVG